jgi:hypothetical protein
MKNYTDIIDYNKLEQVVVVSNTPMYVYSNFQRNQSILELFTSYSDQELINFFYAEINGKRDLTNVTTLYALIVALSFKDSAYAAGFFINLKKMHDLKWASFFAEIYFSKTSFTFLEKSVQPDYSVYEIIDATNNETINYELQ